MSERAIVQLTLWNSPYLGNFMSSELALAHTVRERFGLATHFVLADGAAGQPWLADLDAAGTTWSVLPPAGGAWRAHLDECLRTHRAALLHTHFTAGDLVGVRSAASAGIPCIWHMHTGFDGYPLRQRAKDLLKMRLVARRDIARIVAVSPWLGELARRRGAPADRVVVLPNAIVTERFTQLPERAAARERFGLDPAARVVLGLGWWPEAKGADVLLDALALVAARQPAMQALVVGEEALRACVAARPDPSPPWLRITGFVSDAAWLYAAADVFVSASRHEGQSTAIGEALACGLPVAMSNIPGTAGWAGAPELRTFPSEDAGALAARLGELLAEPPEALAAAGAANRVWLDAHAGIDAWCVRLCDVYAPLLASEPAVTPAPGA